MNFFQDLYSIRPLDVTNRPASECVGVNACFIGPTAVDTSMLPVPSGHVADSLTLEARRARDFARYHGEYPGQTFTRSHTDRSRFKHRYTGS